MSSHVLRCLTLLPTWFRKCTRYCPRTSFALLPNFIAFSSVLAKLFKPSGLLFGDSRTSSLLDFTGGKSTSQAIRNNATASPAKWSWWEKLIKKSHLPSSEGVNKASFNTSSPETKDLNFLLWDWSNSPLKQWRSFQTYSRRSGPKPGMARDWFTESFLI